MRFQVGACRWLCYLSKRDRGSVYAKAFHEVDTDNTTSIDIDIDHNDRLDTITVHFY